jgi:hypothetical protein
MIVFRIELIRSTRLIIYLSMNWEIRSVFFSFLNYKHTAIVAVELKYRRSADIQPFKSVRFNPGGVSKVKNINSFIEWICQIQE